MGSQKGFRFGGCSWEIRDGRGIRLNEPSKPACVAFLAPGGPHVLVLRIFLSSDLDRLL